MGALFQNATIILLIITILSISLAEINNGNTTKNRYKNHTNIEHHSTIYEFDNDISCPIHCNCTENVEARCNRLDIDIQKFTGRVERFFVENAEKKHPIVLSDTIFKMFGLQNLTNFKIVNSIITTISPTAFKDLHVLREVSFTSNNIQIFDPKTFSDNRKLEKLSITKNPLLLCKNDSSPYFIISASIGILDISENNITSIPKSAFSKMTHLRRIDLKQNHLQSIDVGVFSDLKYLQYVDLGQNFLKSIPGDLFRRNSELSVLILKENPISNVADLKIKRLKRLDVSSTNISSIGRLIFDKVNNSRQYLRHLQFLCISNNQIQSLNVNDLKMMGDLKSLDISQNPLRCDEEFESFMTWLVQHRISLITANVNVDIEKVFDEKRNNLYKWKHLVKQICGKASDTGGNDAAGELEIMLTTKNNGATYKKAPAGLFSDSRLNKHGSITEKLIQVIDDNYDDNTLFDDYMSDSNGYHEDGPNAYIFGNRIDTEAQNVYEQLKEYEKMFKNFPPMTETQDELNRQMQDIWNDRTKNVVFGEPKHADDDHFPYFILYIFFGFILLLAGSFGVFKLIIFLSQKKICQRKRIITRSHEERRYSDGACGFPLSAHNEGSAGIQTSRVGANDSKFGNPPDYAEACRLNAK